MRFLIDPNLQLSFDWSAIDLSDWAMVVIALCAVLVSISSGIIQRNHNEASVYPLLSCCLKKTVLDGANQFQLLLTNDGFGPAVIEELRFADIMVKFPHDEYGDMVRHIDFNRMIDRLIYYDVFPLINFDSVTAPEILSDPYTNRTAYLGVGKSTVLASWTVDYVMSGEKYEKFLSYGEHLQRTFNPDKLEIKEGYFEVAVLVKYKSIYQKEHSLQYRYSIKLSEWVYS